MIVIYNIIHIEHVCNNDNPGNVVVVGNTLSKLNM